MATIFLVIFGLLVGAIATGFACARVYAKKLMEAERESAEHKSASLERLRVIEELNAELRKLREDLTECMRLEADSHAKFKSVSQTLEAERKFVAEAQSSLKDSFAALASDALTQNANTLLQLSRAELDKQSALAKKEVDARATSIEHLLKPMVDTLSTLRSHVETIEHARVDAYAELRTMLATVSSNTAELQRGTNSLASALKQPGVRGKYGEVSLKRLIEAAGLNPYCDFQQQPTVEHEDCKLRPDLVIKMPGQRTLVVDSKLPLLSYLNSIESCKEQEISQLRKKHATQVREHVKSLGSKTYWKQFTDSPDFVLMFIAVESSYVAALEEDPGLIEFAMERKVIVSTPSTLVPMLTAIAHTWQQQTLTDNMQLVQKVGAELYERTMKLLSHVSDVGSSIESASKSYNRLVSSLESRFLPQARRMQELSGGRLKTEVPELEFVNEVTKPLKHSKSLDGHLAVNGNGHHVIAE